MKLTRDDGMEFEIEPEMYVKIILDIHTHSEYIDFCNQNPYKSTHDLDDCIDFIRKNGLNKLAELLLNLKSTNNKELN